MPIQQSGSRLRIGQILVEMGAVKEHELEKALAEQARLSKRALIGDLLVEMGFTTESAIAKAVAAKLDIPFLDKLDGQVQPEAIRLIPESMARRVVAIPLRQREHELRVAMAYPQNLYDIDDLSFASKCRILPSVAPKSQILQSITNSYGVVDPIKDLIENIGTDEFEVLSGDRAEAERVADSQETPVIKFVNLILLQAVEQRVSDIHIEPYRDVLRIRYRVDGILRETISPPKKMHPALVTRIKVMAGLDISEHRVPQDGRLFVRTRDGKELDLRVNVVPALDGEAVSIRLLDPTSGLLDIQELGMQRDTEERFRKLIRAPNGLILTTGPTGSGKTTTLYAALSELNEVTRNIVTIEDPVEYRLPSINQIQVNRKAGLSFADGLRSLLRQDPNVILIGEIRDRETAETALEAALTGHLVFSTLHTNDAPGAIARLISMGLDPFIVSSALIGVVGQRLMRLLCPACRTAYEPGPQVIEELGLPPEAAGMLYKANGCSDCRFSGYKLRNGIYEIVENTSSMQELIIQKPHGGAVQKLAQKEGMRSLWESGLLKVRAGLTSPEELRRVTRQVTGVENR